MIKNYCAIFKGLIVFAVILIIVQLVVNSSYNVYRIHRDTMKPVDQTRHNRSSNFTTISFPEKPADSKLSSPSKQFLTHAVENEQKNVSLPVTSSVTSEANKNVTSEPNELSTTGLNRTDVIATQTETKVSTAGTTKGLTAPSGVSGDTRALCPEENPKSVGALLVNMGPKSWDALATEHSFVQNGGVVRPETCRPRHHVAIIIPFRDRDEHLRVFANQIFPILERQQIYCRLVIVEQNKPAKFNRAMLMNIGFAEIVKMDPQVDCFVFHDVDLIPENDKHPYWCMDQPRHLSVAVDKFNYRLPYEGLFGGASAIRRDVFEKVNGFPNVYFGWGGEDDDMGYRIRSHDYILQRYPPEVARYKMIKHGSDSGNEVNPQRFNLVNSWRKRIRTDGLVSLAGTYSVVKATQERMFTRLLVDIDQSAVMKVIRS